MARRILWFSMGAVMALGVAAQPWSRGAEAGPGSKAAATVVAPAAPSCKDDLSQTKQALAASQAEVARLQAEVDKAYTAERTRLQRQQAQLGAPMIDKLH